MSFETLVSHSSTSEFNVSAPSATPQIIQTLTLNNIWKQIPKEILRIVLEYDGKIKYRTGMYIDKVIIHDEQKKLLEKIPKIIHCSQCFSFECKESYVRLTNIFWLIFRFIENKPYFVVFFFKYDECKEVKFIY